MGSESTAHEAEVRMGYWLRGHESEGNNCFSKIQLPVIDKKIYRVKTSFASSSQTLILVCRQNITNTVGGFCY